MLVFPSYERGCNSELVQAVVRFVTPAPLRNPHPTGSAKGCCGAARDIMVLALVGHNSDVCYYNYYVNKNSNTTKHCADKKT